MKVKDNNNLEDYLKNLNRVGFQSTNLGIAREILEEIRKNKATTYLSFTANIIATGTRGYITKMIKEKVVDAVITTAGALEHDVMRSFSDYEIRSFNENDLELHRKGHNRIGNIIVKNKSYETLEKINFEIFERYVEKKLTPSKLAEEYGRYIEKNSKKKEDSFLYYAYKNKIPVFCPGITDGAIGLNAFFFKKLKRKNKNFIIDVVEDLEKLGELTLNAEKTAGIIIGGGISKHHLIGSNIIRGGLDYAIYLTTALEWDGSLSGAKPKEAVSWGKLKEKRKSVVVYGDATITLPLLLEGTL